MLMNDMARCLDITHTSNGLPVHCPWAQKCARYVERNTGGPNTVKYGYLCEDLENAFLPVENSDGH